MNDLHGSGGVWIVQTPLSEELCLRTRNDFAVLKHFCFSFTWKCSLTKIIKENIFQLWSIADILAVAVASSPSDGNSWVLGI